MGEIVSLISEELAILVTFAWGAELATVARYTSCADPLTIGEDTFAAEPSIEVSLAAQTGGAGDAPAHLRMLIRPPLEALTSQRAHSRVQVIIEEINPADAASRRTVFAGVVKSTTRNPQGMTGVVDVEIGGWRLGLEVCANAWAACTTCNNTFGDAICGKDLAAVQETATATAIAGNVLTLTGLTTSTVVGYWRFGYVSFEGLSILIREYTAGSDVLLMKQPPASWLNQRVTLTPGCDKHLATCRDDWDNEARFTGFGIKIPARNPFLES